eukprot:8527539-Pyramimonas_sp.AAC.1
MAPRPSRAPERPPRGSHERPKKAPKGPQKAPERPPSGPQAASESGLREPNMTSKMAHDSPSWLKVAPKMPQEAPKPL